ncbi:hypothetical protein GCM10011402_37790 [Paracoccus acridae]|uniref:Uncharacterized protein n=1 Tax=Paracoccus acridae TaxID=1795310 RepID=A0ABQ1VMK5_9RHOB|nr:hypothetical protein GCM10011402_37790 [Paracoccus acridae]
MSQSLWPDANGSTSPASRPKPAASTNPKLQPEEAFVPTIFLTLYLLVWPVIVFAVLAVISRAFLGEMLEARKEGRTMI